MLRGTGYSALADLISGDGTSTYEATILQSGGNGMNKWFDFGKAPEADNGKSVAAPIDVSANGTTTVPPEHLHKVVLRHFADMKKAAAARDASEVAVAKP